jgi:hypothetical protein
VLLYTFDWLYLWKGFVCAFGAGVDIYAVQSSFDRSSSSPHQGWESFQCIDSQAAAILQILLKHSTYAV